MIPLIIIILVVSALIYYVLHLDFELGTGFTEMKKKIREVKYKIINTDSEEAESEKKLLK